MGSQMILLVPSPNFCSFSSKIGYILVLSFQNSRSKFTISPSDINDWTWDHADLRVLPRRLFSVEFMGFLCNLLCSVYNMYAENGKFPNWLHGFRKLAHYLGYDMVPGSLGVQKLYQLGGVFTSIAMPSFIPSSGSPESLTAIIFVLAWQALPFIYITYFMCFYVLSESSSTQQVAS